MRAREGLHEEKLQEMVHANFGFVRESVGFGIGVGCRWFGRGDGVHGVDDVRGVRVGDSQRLRGVREGHDGLRGIGSRRVGALE